jgi:hypothetical protein
MDPRRIELNRRQSQEMGRLFSEFLELHPNIEFLVTDAAMTTEEEAAWKSYSAELLGRHQAERSALADEIETERRQRRVR